MSALDSIIGKSPEICSLRELIKLLGASDSTVLITGESGTGKELVASALHECSPRSKKPFIPVNCGAIPRDLLESELFGHKRGSFTGAISDRKGRFQLADKGTLFLDEIGDMSMDLQVKLLRVLQERTVDPVGSTSSIPIDVRVVAATHQNIETLIEEGRFRKDLYYRLNIMPVEVIPLMKRSEDIPHLIKHFSALHKDTLKAPITLSKSSADLLCAYDWPGNVRELSNLIARYTALYAEQEVNLNTVPDSMIPSGLRNLMGSRRSFEATLFNPPPTDEPDGESNSFSDIERFISLAQGEKDFPEEGMQLKKHLLEIEQKLIRGALRKAEGNVSKTARLLSLQRTTLIEKINKYGMQA